MAAADTAIALSYLSISLAILVFVLKRKLMRMGWVGGLFASFILLCALSHAMDVWTLWRADYALQIVEKIAAAAVSLVTAAALWPLLPKALAVPTAAELEALVEERTQELRWANEQLTQAKDAAEESEAKFAAMVEFAPEAILLYDADRDRVVGANAMAERLFSRSRDALKEEGGALFLPERGDAAGENGGGEGGAGFVAEGQFAYSKTVAGQDGARECEVRLVALPHGHERLLRASLLDVTKRRRDERELLEKTKALEASNADLEQFAYVASHDLQTPLRNMVRYSQLLEKRYQGRLDADADDFLRFIAGSGKQMTDMIVDLLEFSKTSAQSSPLVPVESGKAVEEALDYLRGHLEEAGGGIEVGNLPKVLGDAKHLASLFLNLVGNGVKYRSPERALKLRIEAERISPEFWRFAVADNGIGIDPQHHDRIFHLFQRLNPNAETQGTGIGLTLCRRIVRRFGGSLWLESSLGGGTTFFFTLRDASA